MLQGIEFEVVAAQPPKLFVIEKRRRATPEIAEALARYYVSGGVIYQAPDLRSVMTTYLVRLIPIALLVCKHSLTSGPSSPPTR
jgi:mediator of RNA polymerase II transcription subunit 6